MMTEDEIILDLARRVDAMEPYTRALVMQRMDQRLRTIPCRAQIPPWRLRGRQPVALA